MAFIGLVFTIIGSFSHIDAIWCWNYIVFVKLNPPYSYTIVVVDLPFASILLIPFRRGFYFHVITWLNMYKSGSIKSNIVVLIMWKWGLVMMFVPLSQVLCMVLSVLFCWPFWYQCHGFNKYTQSARWENLKKIQ